ncbi:Predicted transcriptional regulator with C-terminal CBS domains [Marinactinospora thermotolerans DSM 45154]|uniref:Predicted transcriptional regulator with C-terminal CBS domains n=1 Tax=Marinactinospora thermotolerans DSM 45154 TaxID=1122192 RepID=A0A1T4TG37_9ACTN|nr:helix-turn-helix transcriptional regulator [Marinactinospora thermotolerans]SKA39251.1 Predicted transcriptional regulator with C-terminal CBS domains [Marinactinospora thermotolerans DSM 45154]
MEPYRRGSGGEDARLCGNCGRPRNGCRMVCECIPAWIWRDAEMISAVRDHDAQTVIRLLRRRVHSLSQEALARMCGVAQSTIARAEAGHGLTDRRRALAALQGLGAPGTDVFPDARPPRKQAPAATASSPRALLDHLPKPESLILRNRRARHSMDGVIAAVVALDDQAGGGDLYSPLRAYTTHVRELVDHHGHGMEALGPLSQLTGWIAMDAGERGGARAHLTEAVYAGHETGETDLVSSALSYLSLHETYLGRTRRALALAKTAVETGTGASPAAATMLHARLARAQAKNGDTDAARVSVERMRTAFDLACREGAWPVWLSYIDEIEIESQAGAVYLDMGLFDEALESLGKALALLRARAPHRFRDRSHYLTRAARAHLSQGDVATACDVAGEAFLLAEHLSSPRIDDRIREFRALLAPWGHDDAAQGFLYRSRPLATSPAPSAESAH